MQIKLTEVDNYLDMMNIVIRNIIFLKTTFQYCFKKHFRFTINWNTKNIILLPMLKDPFLII